MFGRDLRLSAVSNEVKERGNFRGRKVLDISGIDLENIGFEDENSEQRKKRKRTRESIKEIASRKKSLDQYGEIAMTAMSPFVNYCSPQLLNLAPSVPSANVNSTHIKKDANSPIEDPSQHSKQLKLFDIQGAIKSDSYRSLKLKESYELQRDNKHIEEENCQHIETHKEEQAAPVTKKSSKYEKENKKIKNGDNKAPTIKIEVETVVTKNLPDVANNNIEIEEDNYYAEPINQDIYNDEDSASLLAINKHSIDKFKNNPKKSPNFQKTEVEAKSDKISNENLNMDVESQGTVKKRSLPFIDKTNQHKEKKNKPKPRVKKEGSKKTKPINKSFTNSFCVEDLTKIVLTTNEELIGGRYPKRTRIRVLKPYHNEHIIGYNERTKELEVQFSGKEKNELLNDEPKKILKKIKRNFETINIDGVKAEKTEETDNTIRYL